MGIALVLVGWMVLAGFLPPPAPDLSTQQVAELWSDHTNAKRLGMVMCVWGGALYVPFTVAVGLLLRRTEVGDRVLSTTQTALGTFGTVFFTLNFLILAVVAFRPARPSEITQQLHDLGFIMTFSPVAPFTLQYIGIGAAILLDRSATPVFPRWVAYANFWIGLLLVPACLIPFFKTGPLAWNGILSFWIPVAVFVAWFVVMFSAITAAARASHITKADIDATT
ncbi:hypothetical protein BN1232_04088 [Mycobacterium lentiflavum]|uniref:Integral membrane protein n=1 Tax=Mycobacterium lentiflavum TaxID=141349 RepID=A0A0E4CPG8_MYCLN|nr:hypothetical protein [Mycobacterium lentiflavum]CQD18018.1 hypothetical protein BN1232_04088 [Mycobacterium lentiflavum]